MRPANDQLDGVFSALAHETRRRILDLLQRRPGAGVGEVAAEFNISRIAIMKHIQVLEDANLIHSEKDGRVRRLFFNSAPIRMIYDRWTDDFSGYWAGEATRLKYAAELRARQSTPSLKSNKGRK